MAVLQVSSILQEIANNYNSPILNSSVLNRVVSTVFSVPTPPVTTDAIFTHFSGTTLPQELFFDWEHAKVESLLCNKKTPRRVTLVRIEGQEENNVHELCIVGMENDCTSPVAINHKLYSFYAVFQSNSSARLGTTFSLHRDKVVLMTEDSFKKWWTAVYDVVSLANRSAVSQESEILANLG